MREGTADDRHPRQRLSPSHLERLRVLNEDLAQNLAAAFSALLRAPADARLADVVELPYGQFVYGLDTPACFYLLKTESLDQRLMLDVEPSILHSMIDRLLGGAGAAEPPGRPLTEIELCLAARLVRVFLEQCGRAWKNVIDLKLDVLQVEENPRLLRVLPADEMVVLLTFELALGESRGRMRFGLPCRAIERLGDRLLAEPPAPDTPLDSRSLAEVRVTLAETPITAAELADLRIGDIIATETDVNRPALVSLDAVAKFRGKPGVYQGRKAVHLDEALDDRSPEQKTGD
jgi:flagellar motor switch protein FliM